MPTRVVRVVGDRRSGTTLIGLLLGQLPGCVFLGETGQSWDAFSTPGWKCGCGRRIAECPFWTEVRRAFPGGEPDFPRLQAIRRSRIRLRPRALPSMLRAPRADDSDLGYYQDAYARYYRGISEATGGAVVIDSSKTATEALLLSRIGTIDLSVLHLVRDPRGVVYSWRHGWRSGNGESAEPREPAERQSLAGIAGRWLAHNAAFEALLRRGSGRYCRRRYEDLLAMPRSSLTSLAPQLGLPGDAHFFRGPDVARLRETHAVEGNPGVLGTREAISLHEDTRWKAEMPRRTRAAVTCMALPLIVRYGYPLDRSIWRST